MRNKKKLSRFLEEKISEYKIYDRTFIYVVLTLFENPSLKQSEDNKE